MTGINIKKNKTTRNKVNNNNKKMLKLFSTKRKNARQRKLF
jgi:hypothetical protein